MSFAPRQLTKVSAAAVVAVAALAAAAWATQACTATPTVVTYTPITGIVVNSESLVTPYGCGKGDDQVFRYAAFLYAPVDGGGATDAAIESSSTLAKDIFECFADGAFVNLPTSVGTAFELVICAYSEGAYTTAGLPPDLECDPGQLGDAAVCKSSQQTLKPCEMPQPGGRVWKTHCQASQEQGVPVIASCDPLRLLTAAADASADATDGGVGDASGSSTDATIDASADGSEGAIDGQPADSTAADDRGAQSD